ncbi:MAG: hypothetical protein WCH52_06345, partial [Bacteroidota bacterium]
MFVFYGILIVLNWTTVSLNIGCLDDLGLSKDDELSFNGYWNLLGIGCSDYLVFLRMMNCLLMDTGICW